MPAMVEAMIGAEGPTCRSAGSSASSVIAAASMIATSFAGGVPTKGFEPRADHACDGRLYDRVGIVQRRACSNFQENFTRRLPGAAIMPRTMGPRVEDGAH